MRVCPLKFFSSQKSFSWSPESEEEMDAYTCSAAAEKWEIFSESVPLTVALSLNNPIPTTTTSNSQISQAFGKSLQPTLLQGPSWFAGKE